tara:strand:+ start:820 stop:1224 length:405 start_codon:yes stop_codon:yes gene_type:complete
MTKKKLKISSKDSRGEIIDIFQNKKYEHATIVTFKKNSIRGNHFHKKSTQYSLILSGKFISKEVKIDSKHSYQKKNIKTMKLNEYNYIIHKPNYAHTFKCLSSKGKLLAFTKGLRGGVNYEKDTFRLKKNLINN